MSAQENEIRTAVETIVSAGYRVKIRMQIETGNQGTTSGKAPRLSSMQAGDGNLWAVK
jgi:hypothetical protein